MKDDGFTFDRTRGSHHVIVVPYTHLSDTFPIGTLRQIIAAAGWTEDDLRRLDLIK